MTFDPTQNRVQTMHLTGDELDMLKAAKHGWLMYCDTYGWLPIRSVAWIETAIYRAKPAPRPTIICNGVEVPEPVREALGKGEMYWVPQPDFENWRGQAFWHDHEVDNERLKRGLIHTSEADAISHAKAMAKAGCV